ncbi:hypothetical protein MVEN_01174300 [Mycena venus]|uniref:Uncharacterized protein n=1 Tax=Mycena venus TaxID=2733690 RepID=A0A8H6Y138_9AGAR|nr:hypothetical protein MVEN_01174300 [Mycena venus]
MSSSPSRSSSPHINDNDDDYDLLMSNVTPSSSPTRKRTADDAQLNENDLEEPLPSALVLRPNGNHLRAITSFATRKRLRPEQVTEVEAFVNDPPSVQLAKIFVSLKANENMLAKFQAAKPHFEINAALKTNLTRAVNAMLCSSKITQYKGEIAKNDVQTLLLRHRWGNFVVGTEHDKFSMDTVQKFIGDVFTQSRSVIKKEIVKSVEVSTRASSSKKKDTPTLRPDATHTTIYQLTKTIAHKLCGGKSTSIPITPALCSRVALMRKWHVKKVEGTVKDTDTTDYWELVDKDLQKIRTTARNGTTDADEIAKRVARAFSSILDKDRTRHGSNSTEQIPDAATATDEAGMAYQADIDEVIEARNRGQSFSGDAEQQSAGEPVDAEDGGNEV